MKCGWEVIATGNHQCRHNGKSTASIEKGICQKYQNTIVNEEDRLQMEF